MSVVSVMIVTSVTTCARGTLARWWANGEVHPELVTAGGQARWDIEDLKRQLVEWRKRQSEDDD